MRPRLLSCYYGVIMSFGPSCTAYSTDDELLIGNLTLGPSTDKHSYVCAAFREINSRIGYLYVLPLPSPPDLAEASALVLNKINNFIASGRLIMALAAGAERENIHAYGLSLVRDGYYELGLILDGTLPLIGAVPTDDSDGSRSPGVSNRDTVSAVEAFEDEFYQTDVFDTGVRNNDEEALWAPGV